MAEPDIICEKRGAAGFVLLNRPQALNALNGAMVAGLAAALDAWEPDAGIERVVVSGAGERAFCAGGDIRLMHDLGKAGDHAAQLRFWREEYILNQRIARYSKPYVALIDGFDMGGGVGISIHGSRRVAGSQLKFAMPEAGIGFFPDVGATYFLPRLPGYAGTWLGLTGARIGAGDACALGLATSHAPSSQFGALARALEASGDTDSIIAQYSAPPPPAAFEAERGVIDACFSQAGVPAILRALEQKAAEGSVFARDTRAQLQRQSPTSAALGLAQMRAGRGLSIEAALAIEFRIVSRICRGHDFYEGVRSVIIDKDNSPRWRPASHDDVSASRINEYFAPLGADELKFPAS